VTRESRHTQSYQESEQHECRATSPLDYVSILVSSGKRSHILGETVPSASMRENLKQIFGNVCDTIS
jgi:hypothetical protein